MARFLFSILEACPAVKHPQEPQSGWLLRVAVIAFVLIIVIFLAAPLVFLFVFFLIWLLSKKGIGN